MEFQIQPNALPDDADTTDDIIDLMADLGAHWKRHRAMGRTPKYIRRAIIDCCADVLALGKTESAK